MFLGLADNIFVDTPGIANTGAAGWVPQSGGVLATMSVDWVTGRAWNAGITTPGALLACARATPAAAYYLNADLTLKTFAANVLRYGTNGLLVEEARTNLVLRSQQFENAAWTTGQSSISADSTLAPDGTLTADTLTEDSSTNSHYVTPAATIVAASNVTYTETLYVKPNGRTKIEIYILDGPPGNLNFNLGKFTLSGSGTVISATNGGTGSGAVGSIDALANGWYRIRLSGQPSTVNTGVISVIIALLDNSGNESYAGDGVSGAIIFGSQVELGAFATSYIPTTTAAVTRALDVVTFNDLTWFDGTSESMHVTWTGRGIVNANLFTLDTVDDVTLNEQAGISPKLSDAGVTYAITTANSGTAGSILKAACRMATNDIALCLNGGTVGTDVTATQPGAITAARLGVDLAGANSLNGYMLSISAWKSQLLTNAALQSIST